MNTLGCLILTESSRGTAVDVDYRLQLILDDDSLDSWLAPDLTDQEANRNVMRKIDANRTLVC